MKHGNLVKIDGTDKVCVVLFVSPKDVRRGINVYRPGLHLFRGYWYGNDPLSLRSYGKIEGTALTKDAM